MAGNGYATTSRKKILEYLMANSDRTVTVTDIDQYLKKHDNEVNITTIYRYLDKLAKEGTVMKYVAEKGSQALFMRKIISTCAPKQDRPRSLTPSMKKI